MKLTIILTFLVLSLQAQKRTINLVFFEDCKIATQSEIRLKIAQFYGCEVNILKPVKLPKNAYYPPRNRFRADKLLQFMKPLYPQYTLGITTKDISTTAHGYYDWGVMGLSFQPGNAAIMSSYRIKSFNGSVNTAIHEIGHMMGLSHCPNTRCLMTSANGKGFKYDSLEPYMCNSCKIKINGK